MTYLVSVLGQSLTEAGLAFAVFQGAGVFGRLLLGWASDRLGSGMGVLRSVAVASALTTLALVLASEAGPVWTLMFLGVVAGVTVSSWNGVLAAEIAHVAPRPLVGETAASAAILTFCGYFVGRAALPGSPR